MVVDYSLPDYFLRDIWVSNGYAYVIAPESLLVFDISSLSEPQIIMSVHVPIYALSLFLSENLLFIAAYGNGLQLFDTNIISHGQNTEEFETRTIYPTFDKAQGIFVRGNYAYVADGFAGLVILDISDITNPVLVGVYNTPGYALRVYVVDNLAYVADSYGGLRIIDVSDVSNPHEIGHHQTPGYARDVVVKNGYAYVADNEGGLLIFDVTDPSNPVEISSFPIPEETNYLTLYQRCGVNFVFVSTDSGIRQIDISDIYNPRDLGFCYSGTTLGLTSEPNYNCSRWVIFAAASFSAIYHIVPIWIEEGRPDVWWGPDIDQAEDVARYGRYLVIADRYGGTIVYRETIYGYRLEIVGFYITPDYAHGIALAGNYVLVADKMSGVQIYHYDLLDISETSYSNNFDLKLMSSKGFDIQFMVPAEEKLKLQLFDVSGREVWSGDFGPGTYRIQRNIPSGVYLLKATGRGISATRKLLVVNQ